MHETLSSRVTAALSGVVPAARLDKLSSVLNTICGHLQHAIRSVLEKTLRPIEACRVLELRVGSRETAHLLVKVKFESRSRLSAVLETIVRCLLVALSDSRCRDLFGGDTVRFRVCVKAYYLLEVQLWHVGH